MIVAIVNKVAKIIDKYPVILAVLSSKPLPISQNKWRMPLQK
jgi:hypothetical protein